MMFSLFRNLSIWQYNLSVGVIYLALLFTLSFIPPLYADQQIDIQCKDGDGNVLRQWHVEFDDKGQLTKYSAGSCSGGCGGGGGGFQNLEYYYADEEADERYEGLIKKKFNYEGDIILWNKYTLDIEGMIVDPNEEGYVNLPVPLLSSQEAVRDPNGANDVIKFQEWEYDGGEYTAIKKIYVDDTDYRVIKYYYADDSFSQVIQKIEYEELNEDPENPQGNSYSTYYQYDPNEAIITYPSGKRKDIQEYNDNHQVEKSYVLDNESDLKSLLESYTYDGSGYMTAHIDARGAKTEYYYDDGLLSWRKDPNNYIGIEPSYRMIKVDYDYDDARRVIQEEEFHCNSQGASCQEVKKVSYDYDSSTGFLLSQKVYGWDEDEGDYTDQPEVTEYRYNIFGEQTRVLRPDGVVTGMSYNLAGQLSSEFVLSGDSDPNDADPDLILISQTKYTYDDNGRVKYLEKANDEGEFNFNDPDAWIKTVYEYDFLGRKTAVVEDANDLALKTSYEYNHQGELVKTILPNGKWTETERDGRGKTIKQIVGYGTGVGKTTVATTEFKYDANGNMIEKKEPYTDPDGNNKYVKTTYGYDNYDRLIRVQRGIVSSE